GVQGPPVQPRDARGEIQEPVDRRRARDERRRGARVLPEHPSHQAVPADPLGRGARIREARTARADAVGRRGPADQARLRAAEAGHRQHALRARRAHHRAALRGHPQAARGAPAARRGRQHGSGDRAQPRRHQDRGLDRRPRARGRRRRRSGRGGRSAGGRRGRPELPYRPVPGRGAAAVPARRRGARRRRGQEGGARARPVGLTWVARIAAAHVQEAPRGRVRPRARGRRVLEAAAGERHVRVGERVRPAGRRLPRQRRAGVLGRRRGRRHALRRVLRVPAGGAEGPGRDAAPHRLAVGPGRAAREREGRDLDARDGGHAGADPRRLDPVRTRDRPAGGLDDPAERERHGDRRRRLRGAPRGLGGRHRAVVRVERRRVVLGRPRVQDLAGADGRRSARGAVGRRRLRRRALAGVHGDHGHGAGGPRRHQDRWLGHRGRRHRPAHARRPSAGQDRGRALERPPGRRLLGRSERARRDQGWLGTAGDGTIHVAYYAGSEIHEATSRDGASWQVTKVADVGSGQNEAGRSTGVAVDSSGTVYVTWYDPGTDSVQLAAASGGQFQPVAVQDTAGGDLPSLGVTGDGSAVYVAWYDEVDQNLMLGTYGSVSSLELAVPSPTPTGAPTSAPSPSTQCTQAQNGTVAVTASGIAFDTNCIEVPAGQPFTIAFDNKDAGIPHNIAIYPSSTQLTPADALFQGEVVTGPTTTQYKVPALDAGTYYFHCDIHPTTMNGTFKVVTSGGGGGATTGGGGGGGTSGGGGFTTAVTASGIAFDVATITLKANTATTLTFDNKDAGIPHNIAIYPSASELTSPLFRGDI